MATGIVRSDAHAHTSFDPFTADDASLIVWMDERKAIREDEDRAAYEAWLDECEAARLREEEAFERIGNGYDWHPEA